MPQARDARVVCEEFGFSSDEVVRQCEEIGARFLASDLMKRVKREFCELSFVVTVAGVRIAGKIDRLCELSDGSWIVIDYKSDPVSLEEYALKVEEYAVSMGIYVEAARQVVGGTVAGWLYFTETGEFWRAVWK